jgi:hypothetical protein
MPGIGRIGTRTTSVSTDIATLCEVHRWRGRDRQDRAGAASPPQHIQPR